MIYDPPPFYVLLITCGWSLEVGQTLRTNNGGGGEIESITFLPLPQT